MVRHRQLSIRAARCGKPSQVDAVYAPSTLDTRTFGAAPLVCSKDLFQVTHDRTGTTVPKPATIKDVAQLAGVSAATVSLVLNDVANSRITPSTADRVRSAATALGYAPNPLARGLRR